MRAEQLIKLCKGNDDTHLDLANLNDLHPSSSGKEPFVFDPAGYDRYGYDKYGYDKYGYDKYGYDKKGYDKGGLYRYPAEKPVAARWDVSVLCSCLSMLVAHAFSWGKTHKQCCSSSLFA